MRDLSARYWRGLAVAVLAVFLAAAAGVAVAATFVDVPSTSPFKEDIDWAVDAGIATGFPDDTFRPRDPVNRQQAARWFRTYNAGTELVSVTVNAPPAATAFTRNVSCPAGSRVLSGGGHMSDSGLYLSDSWPLAETIWSVTWRTLDGGSASPSQFTVWALCGIET